jgi:hypothetical protein
MRKRNNASRGWLIVGLLVPATMVVWAELNVTGFPVVTGFGVLLVAAVAVAGGIVEQRNGLRSQPAAPAGPERSVERLAAPLLPFTVRVAAQHGACPLGFRPGDQWTVGATGQVSDQVCLPLAIAARRLTSTWTEAIAEPDPKRRAACNCPWAAARLSFRAGAARTTAA